MIARKLMAHLMCDVIYVEIIADGCRLTGHAIGFAAVSAHHAQAGHSSATGAEYVSYIVISRTNNIVDVGLVFAQHGGSVVVGVRV